MRFPGKRKTKHYFPVDSNERGQFNFATEVRDREAIYVAGMDQLIVDLEAQIEESFLQKFNLKKGESQLLSDELMTQMLTLVRDENRLQGTYAGGSTGNTLHNFSVLAETRAVALGTISDPIRVGDEAFKYITTTHSLVDFSYLFPCAGPMGKALCLITPDGERTFAIAQGIMDHLPADSLHPEVIQGASALIVSTYLFRNESAPIFGAAMRSLEIAREAGVPVIFALGTQGLVREKRDWLLKILPQYASVIAMNESEAQALFGEGDALKTLEKALDCVDLALLTVGPRGLYIGAHVDRKLARHTDDPIMSKSIPEYNKFEYSRAMRRSDCAEPLKIYTHINPYHGGPTKIQNTNGAGDAALAALMHDMASNRFHSLRVPNSPKHRARFLTYSSIHQISKYCNRVSFEVLSQHSPRLVRGLPEQEDALEEAYWDL